MMLDNILNEAIDRIIQGDQAGLDDLLATHPESRPEVEPLLEIAQQLASTLPTEAPQAFVLATRRQLILRAAARRTAMQKRQEQRFSLPALFRRRPMRRLAYAAAALAVTLALILGGGGGVAVAQSLPGQPLYGAKRTAEDVPLLVVADVFVRADYLITLLDRRVLEVETLSLLNQINTVALTEVRMATARALTAVEIVPLEHSLARWTRLEATVALQKRVLTQIVEKSQVTAANEESFTYAWQVCANTQTQAQGQISTLPPQAGATVTPPGLTKTPEPPGLTRTPEPPGQTRTPDPPGQTRTPQPPGQTRTPQPPGLTRTPEPTATPEPSNTASPVPPEPTSTPQQPTATPEPTNTKPVPPGLTMTPQPPGLTKTPKPPKPTKTPK